MNTEVNDLANDVVANLEDVYRRVFFRKLPMNPIASNYFEDAATLVGSDGCPSLWAAARLSLDLMCLAQEQPDLWDQKSHSDASSSNISKDKVFNSIVIAGLHAHDLKLNKVSLAKLN